MKTVSFPIQTVSFPIQTVSFPRRRESQEVRRALHLSPEIPDTKTHKKKSAAFVRLSSGMTIFLMLLFTFQAYAESSVSVDDIIDSLGDELAGNEVLPQEGITNETESGGSYVYKPKANIIILNKITAKSELVEFEIGKAQVFGNIVIEVKKCAANKDPVRSANLMLVTVFDKKLGEDKSLIFAGWIDSINLSVSTVEHPVYDVIPKGCEG